MFETCITSNPAMALKLLKTQTLRVRRLTNNVKNLALLDVYGRVARALLNLATQQDDIMVIEHRVTHQDIAKMVGASREMVSRIMKDLTTGGYITCEGHHITINESLPTGW
jgi:CRP/FNR family cyclic AMP-dependent transcriptional regulator